jgi:hypothetical protein
MRSVRAYLLALSAADAGALRMLKNGAANILAGTQFTCFTCFTGTKVQILTQKADLTYTNKMEL